MRQGSEAGLAAQLGPQGRPRRAATARRHWRGREMAAEMDKEAHLMHHLMALPLAVATSLHPSLGGLNISIFNHTGTE